MHLETMCSWSRSVIGLRGLIRVSLYFLPSNFWDAPLEFCRWAVGQGSTQHRNLIQISPSKAIPAFPPANSTRLCRRNLERREKPGRTALLPHAIRRQAGICRRVYGFIPAPPVDFNPVPLVGSLVAASGLVCILKGDVVVYRQRATITSAVYAQPKVGLVRVVQPSE